MLTSETDPLKLKRRTIREKSRSVNGLFCPLFFVLCTWLFELLAHRSAKHEAQRTKYALRLVIMISYLGNLWEGDLDDVAIRTFHFDTWSGECLCSFQTVNDSAHSSSVCSENLDVWLAVKRLKCRQGFRHFQGFVPPASFNQPRMKLCINCANHRRGYCECPILS